MGRGWLASSFFPSLWACGWGQSTLPVTNLLGSFKQVTGLSATWDTHTHTHTHTLLLWVCYKLKWGCELITSSHSVSMKCPTKKHPGYCYFLFFPLNSNGRAKKLIAKCQKWIDYTQFSPKSLSNQCTGPYFSHFMGQQGKLLRRANLQLCS